MLVVSELCARRYGPLSRSSARRDASVRAVGRSRCPEGRRAGPWRGSDLSAVRPQCFHELRETRRTVGVRERKIGQLHAMGLSIRPLRNPVLTISVRLGLVSNLSAEATDREQRRCDTRLCHGRGRRLTSGLSDQSVTSHTAPPSFTRQTGTSNAAMC